MDKEKELPKIVSKQFRIIMEIRRRKELKFSMLEAQQDSNILEKSFSMSIMPCILYKKKNFCGNLGLTMKQEVKASYQERSVLHEILFRLESQTEVDIDKVQMVY